MNSIKRIAYAISLIDTSKPIESVPEKELIGKLVDGTNVYLVDGGNVRDSIFVDFALGSHGYEDSEYIPSDEIWIERTGSKHDMTAISIHEIVEQYMMKNLKSE